MIKENKVENTITDFPRDFWNYAVNPISGFIMDTISTRLKRPPTTIGYDNTQRRKAAQRRADEKRDTLNQQPSDTTRT